MLAIPRQVWGNLINFAAAARAIYVYAESKAGGRAIAWGKTSHTFPSAIQLQASRQRLGELLLERQAVTLGQLELALDRQRRDRRPLGEILVRMGAVRAEEIDEVLGRQRAPSFRTKLAEAQ